MDAIESPNIVGYIAHRIGLADYIAPDILTGILILGGMLGLGWIAVRRQSNRPNAIQNILEVLLDAINTLGRQFIGPAAPRYLSIFTTIFMFILFANLIGLVPGFMSPTANLNVNAGLAITVMLITASVRLRQHGIVGFVKYYCGPPYWLAPLFIVIRVMEEIIRPLSLTMRLFGNIMSKEIILSILVYMMTLLFFADNLYSKILMLVPFLLRPLVILLGVVVSLVQALVFTGLSMVYVGEAVNGH